MELSKILNNIPIQFESTVSSLKRDNNQITEAKDAVEGFEAMFLSSIFTEMTKSSQLGGLGEKQSMEKEWVWTMMAQTISKEMASRESLGLENLILQKMHLEP